MFFKALTRSNEGWAPVYSPDNLNIDFIAKITTDEIKSRSENTFEVETYVYTFDDEPDYSDLSKCNGRVVVISFGGWTKEKDAAMFAKPWIDAVTMAGAKRILAFYDVLSEDMTTYRTRLIEQENGNRSLFKYEPRPVEDSFIGGRDSSDWRELPRTNEAKRAGKIPVSITRILRLGPGGRISQQG